MTQTIPTVWILRERLRGEVHAPQEGLEAGHVPDNRLGLAIEQDAGVDVMHACGGNARCTTCRVEFIEGEPAKMTAVEMESSRCCLVMTSSTK